MYLLDQEEDEEPFHSVFTGHGGTGFASDYYCGRSIAEIDAQISRLKTKIANCEDEDDRLELEIELSELEIERDATYEIEYHQRRYGGD